jgi:hypothetical protein
VPTSIQFDAEVSRLARRTVPLERFVHCFAAQLSGPQFFPGRDERGFRYDNPNYRHFCLLRSCRMVSALNASIALAKTGFVQEIGVLLRTVIEYSSQVEYVLLNRDASGEPSGKVATFIASFFEDDRRTTEDKVKKRTKLNQKDVHNSVGGILDDFVSKQDGERTASDLMSHVYVVFSNYVHGRYPESMDLFGGTPGHFHLVGMRHTPKDGENIEIIDTFVTTVSNTLVQIAQAFDMYRIIDADETLAEWYRECIGS